MSDQARPIRDVFEGLDQVLRRGGTAAPRTWSTGFPALDEHLAGGVRAGELVLVGGPQGLGKTTLVLQLLRNVAAAGGRGLYIGFEHDEETILSRLLALEIGESDLPESLTVAGVRRLLENPDGGTVSLSERLAHVPDGMAALHRFESYAGRLFSYRAGATTDLTAVRHIVGTFCDGTAGGVVVVDYLQKLASALPERDDFARITAATEGLKDLAFDQSVPVVAVSAADREGIEPGRRLRTHQLRGSSALAYEADVVLLLNDKFDVVARHHLMYNVSNLDRYHEWVVISIEKNRTGMDKVDLEFRKQFARSRFDPGGDRVREQLVDERVFVE
jgi:replicative DNA helicase